MVTLTWHVIKYKVHKSSRGTSQIIACFHRQSLCASALDYSTSVEQLMRILNLLPRNFEYMYCNIAVSDFQIPDLIDCLASTTTPCSIL